MKMQKLVPVTAVIVSLMACRPFGRDVKSRAVAQADKSEATVSPIEGDEFIIGDSLEMTDSEWSNLKARNDSLTQAIKNLVGDIGTTVESCIEIVRQHDKITGDLELGTKEDLAGVDEARLTRDLKVEHIANLKAYKQGLIAHIGKVITDVISMESSLAAIGPNLRAALGRSNRDLADQMAKTRAALIVVHKNQNAILNKSPFDEAAYDAEDVKETALQNDLAQATSLRNGQVNLLRKVSVIDRATLTAQLAQAKKDRDKAVLGDSPKLVDVTKEIKKQNAILVQLEKDVAVFESRQKIVVVNVPKECGMLGVLSATDTDTSGTSTSTSGAATTTGGASNSGVCATSLSISNHVDQTSTGLLDENSIGSNDGRFCVHKITDGTKRLLNGVPIASANLRPRTGLSVAFSDVNYKDNGGDFLSITKICAGLTVGGAIAGQWSAVKATHLQSVPSTTVLSESAEALSAYFQDPAQPFIGYWTISESTMGGAEAGGAAFMNLQSGLPANGLIEFTATHFRHQELGLGVICVK